MLGSFSKPPAEGQSLQQSVQQVALWTRRRFALGDDDAVLVAEIECVQPGCPPLETVVAFWTEAAAGEQIGLPNGDPSQAARARPARHHFKVFKPVASVCEDDLPYAWMKNSLLLSEGEGCDCC